MWMMIHNSGVNRTNGMTGGKRRTHEATEETELGQLTQEARRGYRRKEEAKV